MRSSYGSVFTRNYRFVLQNTKDAISSSAGAGLRCRLGWLGRERRGARYGGFVRPRSICTLQVLADSPKPRSEPRIMNLALLDIM